MGRCYNSTVIHAPCEKVWQTIRNFHDLAWAAPVVISVDKVGEVDGNQVGAKRVLNGVFYETLLSIDDENHHLSYSIDDGPEPVSKDSVTNYIGTVHLYPVTDNNTTFIVWGSAFKSSSDAAVSEFCNPIYAGMLAALRQTLNE